MQSPLISIIIVVYNGAAKIKTSLESISKQSFRDFELIIIDGGSTDGTIDIIKQFSEVSYWSSEPDKGIYDAMNKGVIKTTGKWLYFLGCDDKLFDPASLEKAAAALEKTDADLLYGNVIMNGAVYDGPFDYDKLLEKNISHQGLFYKRSVFDKVGFYNLSYKLHADWDFNIRCFLYPGLKIEYADFLVAEFGPGGVSSAHDVPFLREVIIPLTAEQLRRSPREMRSIRYYDRWWRLLRNAGIKHAKELNLSGAGGDIPLVLIRMINFQSKLPAWALTTGVLSKLFMAFHFVFTMLRTLNRFN
jgi:glycosyltransferase involved in cell wall biosynthesis